MQVFSSVCFCLLHSEAAVNCWEQIFSKYWFLEMDEAAADSEGVKAAEEGVTEADTSNEAKCDATDLPDELQEQLARLACLDPLAVAHYIIS